MSGPGGPRSGKRALADDDVYGRGERACLEAGRRGQSHLDALALAWIAGGGAKDAVALVARLAGDIELAGQQAAAGRRDLDVDVRRAAGIGDGLERAETVAAVGRHHAAVTLEGAVTPFASGLARM